MHILNALLDAAYAGKLVVQDFLRGGCLPDAAVDPVRRTEEGSPLLGQGERQPETLSDEFQDFSHSSHAFWICFWHIIVYYSLAVLGFSALIEKWSVITSLYFATVLFTTIGYGDFCPATLWGQIYAICLALYGIVILGIFLGIAGELVVDSHTDAVKQSNSTAQSSVIANLTDTLSDAVISSDANDDTHVPAASSHSNQDTAAPAVEPTWLDDVWGIAVLEAPIVTVVIFGGLGVGYLEDWSVTASLYWLVITGTTVGLGDFHPTRPAVRFFCCFFLPFAVAVLGELLARIATVYMDRKNRIKEKAFMARALSLSDLTKMDADGNGMVEKTEFLSHMLVALQKCSKEDIDQICALFEKLDVTKSGFLSKDDLVSRKFGSALREPSETTSQD